MMSGRLLSVMLVVLLTACGGGGGGGNSGGVGGQSGKYSITLNTSSVTLSAVEGQEVYVTQDIDVTYKGDGVIVGTLPGSLLPLWLNVSDGMPTGTGKARFSLTADASGLAVGRHSTTLRFVTGAEEDEDIVYKDLAVVFTVQDQISIDVEEITLNQIFPSESSAASLISISDASQVGWRIRSDVEWLNFSTTSGSGSIPVLVSVNTAALFAAGIHNAEVTLDVGEQGEIKVPVTLNIEARRIYAQARAVALVNTANTSRLSAAIQMVDGTNTPEPDWQVGSSAEWLSITGIEGNTINVSANPAGLESGIHYAEVVVSSTVAGITATEKVNVSLYKLGENSVEGEVLQVNTNSDPASSHVVSVVDPLRPYIYLCEWDSVIRRINVHTGEEDSPFPLVDTPYFSSMAVSSDGEILYAHAMDGQVYELNLVENTWTSFSYLRNFFQSSRMTEIHPNGKSLLLMEDGPLIVDPETAQVLMEGGDEFWPLTNRGAMTVSGDQKSLVGVDLGSWGARLQQWGLAYHYNTNELALWRTSLAVDGILSASDIAGNAAGNLIVIDAIGDSLFTLYESGFVPVSDAVFADGQGNVEISSDNVLYSGTSAYDSAGNLLRSYSIDSMSLLWEDRGLRISGDGSRVLMIASAGDENGGETSLWVFPAIE